MFSNWVIRLDDLSKSKEDIFIDNTAYSIVKYAETGKRYIS